MHRSQKILAAAGLALTALGLFAGGSALAPPAQAGVSIGVVVPAEPPAPRYEPVPPPPSAYRPGRVVWQPGYWRWTGRDYVWMSGHYVRIPRHRQGWVEGHWDRRPGGWVWIGGRWR